MRKGFLQSAIILGITSLTLFSSCKKTDNLSIDNNEGLKTPFTLFAASVDGWLVNTNNGNDYRSVFPADGYAPVSLITARENILLFKENVHVSDNNGKNFRLSYNQARKFPWQNCLSFSTQQQRIYVTSLLGNGIAYSDDYGNNWQTDMAWDISLPDFFEVNSFATLDNGSVMAFSDKSFVLFVKENRDAAWIAVNTNGLLAADNGDYFISSNGQRLFLIDHQGKNPAFHSDDNGINWLRHPRGEMPGGKKAFAVHQQKGGPILIGVDSAGVFRANDEGAFVSSNYGLIANISVYGFAVKKDIFKNDAEREYMFISTSNGIYRSDDKGINWYKLSFNQWDLDYRVIY